MARKLITAVLDKQQLKALRAKPFLERNKIIQDKLNMKQRERIKKLQEEDKKGRNNFIF